MVENLDVEVLAGTPFMEVNDIAVRPAKRLITLADGTSLLYGSLADRPTHYTARRAVVLRAPAISTTIWPGDYVELELPQSLPPDSLHALEPRTDIPQARLINTSELWPPPGIISSEAGRIRVPNLTSEPIHLSRHDHFCQVSPVFSPSTDEHPQCPAIAPQHPITSPTSQQVTNFSSGVQLDSANLLPPNVQSSFRSLLCDFDTVFDPTNQGYNGAVGPFQAKVNMGPVKPPQHKGRLPQYSRDKLQDLQNKFDELEKLGVFKRPQDINVTVEYLNPSFLVKKSNGGYRLVTAFADVGRYSKPQPSLMPDVDATLRQIAQWKHIITTDLTSAFHQIPLARESMKYCGVATPFRGVRVYTRSAMGKPGSETALEELMCRVLGDLIHEGVVAKIADDLYCGADPPEGLLRNWTQVLQALSKCALKLSASKTIINPKTITILGWVWNSGTLQASPHRFSALSTCSKPTTVGRMRSFIGAYKVLARVIPQCSALLTPLDTLVAGRQSQENITWSDDLIACFHHAQSSLSSSRVITLPRQDDQLWIITDGAVRSPGIGATLYVTRANTLRLAGFFSAKLRGHQLPCEIEALSIASATKHFSPYIIQSKTPACILTDSKPCVQAFEKLCRGELSSSPCVATFLSTVSRNQASVRHVAGAAILPSDFSSRNAPDCDNRACQVCNFVQCTEDSVVLRASVQSILSGEAKLPFISCAAWLPIQTDCPDLRRTHAHLTQGTRPSKKLTNIKDVKRYLNVATIASDGLLVVKRSEPLAPTRERIVVPRQVLDGLMTALHPHLSHPSSHQLKLVTQRYLFALDMDKAIERATTSCHHCASLRVVPPSMVQQSTNPPPDTVGVSFAADVIKRARQLILVLRECVTSYTASTLLPNERHDTLRDALLSLCIEMRPLDGPLAVVRTDPAPCFLALENDSVLHEHRIALEIGRVKNRNKNPVAEKAVQELELELLRQDPHGGPVSPVLLSVATATLNSRIRTRGLSAREMWTQRDQFSSTQIPLNDLDLITKQHDLRVANHPSSTKAKAHHIKEAPNPTLTIGELVYLYCDHNKSRARDRYLVVSIDGAWCHIRKFVGSQLRSTSYRVKKSECYKVPTDTYPPLPHDSSSARFDTDEDEDDFSPHQSSRIAATPSPPALPPSQFARPPPPPPDPPPVPTTLSTPPSHQTPGDPAAVLLHPQQVRPRCPT